METERDINAILKKKYQNEVLNIYPKTNTDNTVMDNGESLETFIEQQKLKNQTYSDMKEKLDTIDRGAQKNQNAYTTLKVGNRTVAAEKMQSELEFIPGENIIVTLENGKINISTKPSNVPLASLINDGLISSKDFKKLQDIDEKANYYQHPTNSSVIGSYTSVQVDEYGHVYAGIKGALPMNLGGTGAATLEDIKKNLDIPDHVFVEHELKENSINPISSSAMYKELAKKAEKSHGNHVPDSSLNPNSLSFLKEGNEWGKIPYASTTSFGVTQLVNEINETNKTSDDSATAKAVYDFVTSLKNAILGNDYGDFDSFSDVNTWFKTHSSEFTKLQKAVSDGDSSTLESAKSFIKEEINRIINGASSAYDTFKEIETWIGEHTDLYNKLIEAVATKAVKTDVDNELAKKANVTDVNTELAKKANVSDMTAALSGKVDKINGKGLTTNDLTNNLKANYDNAYTHATSVHAPLSAEKNIIIGIKKNGVEISPDTEREVNITVPTKVSDLDNDSNFNNYIHPSYTSRTNGFYKVTIDSTGHVSNVTSVTKSDITALGITDTIYTHPTTSGNKHIPTGGTSGQLLGWDSDGTAKWVNKESYNLPIASSSALGGIKTGYTTNGKKYKVEVDSSGNAYVNVPWTSTNTTTPVVDNLTSSSTDQSLSANQGRVLKAMIDGKSDANHSHDKITGYSQGTRLTSCDFNSGTNGPGSIFGFAATSTMTTGKPPSDSAVLQMNWDRDNGYDVQVGVATGGSNMYFRGMSNGTWKDWNTIIHSKNFNTQIKPTFTESSEIESIVNGESIGSSYGKIAAAINILRSEYAECGTSSTTANKVVVCPWFKLYSGAHIRVKFTQGNSTSNPTLNVAGTGAKSIGFTNVSNFTYMWKADAVVEFVYDGSKWLILGQGPASITNYGVTLLDNSVSNTSSGVAATSYAVKKAYDRATTAYNGAGLPWAKFNLSKDLTLTSWTEQAVHVGISDSYMGDRASTFGSGGNYYIYCPYAGDVELNFNWFINTSTTGYCYARCRQSDGDNLLDFCGMGATTQAGTQGNGSMLIHLKQACYIYLAACCSADATVKMTNGIVRLHYITIA